MAGHMGADRVTMRNLKVLQVDAENNLLIVEGAVPGGPNGVRRDSQGGRGQARTEAAAEKAQKGKRRRRRSSIRRQAAA